MLKHLLDKPSQPERVVVIGGSGFVGGALVHNLQEKELNVVSLSSTDIDLTGDDSSKELAEVFKENDVVVAVSAKAPARDIGDIKTNVEIIKQIDAAVRDSRIAHFINIGSDAVFCDLPLPLTELSVRAPASAHGLMHLTRELIFEQLAIPVATIRPTLIYGAKDPHNGYGPNSFARLAREEKDIFLFGEGEERRDHIYVDDVAELIARVILHRSIGSLNAATGAVRSFKEIALMTIRALSSGSEVKSKARKGPMPHNGLRTFDPSAVYKAFPSFEFTDFGEGLRQLIQPEE